MQTIDIIKILKEYTKINKISQGKVSKKIKEKCRQEYIKNRNNIEEIRFNNLQIVTKLLKKNNIQYWCQGKTLAGITSISTLLEKDHDDDIGIWNNDLIIFMKNIHNELLKNNFSLIRISDGIISYLRNNRWLDICLFHNKKTVGYAKKKFKKEHYLNFTNFQINPNNKTIYNFQIPSMYNNILKESYNKIEVNLLEKSPELRNYCVLIIWYHGLKNLNDIIKQFQDNYEIIFIKNRYYDKISTIIDKIYKNEDKKHIKNKTAYLNDYDSKVAIMLLKSKSINYEKIKELKWKIRSMFNPKYPNKEKIPAKFIKYTSKSKKEKYKSVPDDILTHHHIIHSPDNLHENKYLIKIFNIKYVKIKDEIHF